MENTSIETGEPLLKKGEIDFKNIDHDKVRSVVSKLVAERVKLISKSDVRPESIRDKEIEKTYVFTDISAFETCVVEQAGIRLEKGDKFMIRFQTLGAKGALFRNEDENGVMNSFVLVKNQSESELLHELSHVADAVAGLTDNNGNFPSRALVMSLVGTGVNLVAQAEIVPIEAKLPMQIISLGLVAAGMVGGIKYWWGNQELRARTTSKRVSTK